MGQIRDAEGRLLCDACGGRPARRYACPHGYCPSAILCADCHRGSGWLAPGRHEACRAALARMAALDALRAADPDAYARSATGSPAPSFEAPVPAGYVGIVTHAGNRYLIRGATYRGGEEPLPAERLPWPARQ